MLMHTYQSHKLTDLRRSLILFHCIYFVFPFIGKTRWYWTTGKLSTKLFLFSSLLTLPPLSLSLDLQGPSGATGSKVSYTTHSSLSSHVLSLSLCLRDHPVSAQAVLYSQTQQRLISTSVPQGRTQHYPNTEPCRPQSRSMMEMLFRIWVVLSSPLGHWCRNEYCTTQPEQTPGGPWQRERERTWDEREEWVV